MLVPKTTSFFCRYWLPAEIITVGMITVMWTLYCLSVLCRWGNLPLDDALQFEHGDVVKILKDYQQVYSPGKAQLSGEERSPRLDTMEVIA